MCMKGLTGCRQPLTFSRIENLVLLLRRMWAFCKLPCAVKQCHWQLQVLYEWAT